MSRPIEWTSTGSGWFIVFKKPDDFEKLLKSKDKEAMRQHYEDCFEKLYQLLPNTMYVMSEQRLFGTCCVAGNEAACLAFKSEIEKRGLGTMEKNDVVLHSA